GKAFEGTATILFEESLAKYSNKKASSSSGSEEVGSYQLCKRNSNKPQILLMFRSGSPRKEKNLVHTWLQVTLIDIAYGYHDLVMVLFGKICRVSWNFYAIDFIV
ncbi:unnamed protein product, partial [Linum tenue]